MILETLKTYWGYDSFRPLQAEIIQSVLAGYDTLALLPTGGGKSICFQVPALELEGICIVVTPLIALMKDQVEQLEQRGIAAAAIYAGMSKSLIDKYLEESATGKIKFLYVSPERLKTELMIERTKRMQVSLLAIVEAHCISQWGYDFRPAYLEIAQFRERIPEAKLIALTATATPEVKKDIQEKLAFGEKRHVFQKSFARSSLSYACLEEENKERRLLQILQKVPGTAIVYARNRKRTREIAEILQRNQIAAQYYHAGLSNQQRAQRQEAWIKNETRVMVSTNAFGMGIDKPDVRVVVHWDLPDSLEAYYQEAGRAGRDEQKAYAVALYQSKDLSDLEQKIEQSYPPREVVLNVYQALANYYHLAVNAGEMLSFDFDLEDFQQQFPFKGLEIFHALKKLEEAGFVQLNEAYHQPSKLTFLLDFKALYEFQLKHPGAEPLITLISRLRGGEMQRNFFAISEATLARYLKISVQQVIKQLERLQSLNVVVYEKQKEKPQLTFLTPRYDAKRLPLDWPSIEARKQRDLAKVKAVQNYTTHQHRCRSLMLQEYFGEISDQNCGVCDFCVAQKRKQTQTAFSPAERARTLEILAKGPLSIHALIRQLNPEREQDSLQSIRQMIEVGQIEKLEDGRIMLKKSKKS